MKINIINNQHKFSQLIEWLQKVKPKMVGLDTETESLNPLESKILLLQLGTEYEQFVIDVAKVDIIGKNNMKYLIQLINELNSIIIMHNAKFDYQMIKTNYDIEINKIFCTMLATQLLTAGFTRNISVSLENTISRYLNKKLDKSTRETFFNKRYGSSFTEEQLKYAALDVKYLIPLYEVLVKKLKKYNLLDVALLEFNTVKITADMELNGILIDTKKWLKLEEEALREASEIRKKLDELMSPYIENINGRDIFGNLNINYDSPVQVVKALKVIFGDSISSSDEKTLKKLNHIIADTLLEYRKRKKLATTYGSAFIKNNLQQDGKIRSTFNQLGADTGRYSSKSPNLQQIPNTKKYREPIIAPDGYDFISADFSGQELRLLAQLSQETSMIDALKSKKDLHSFSASLLYGIPYEEFFEHEDSNKNVIKTDKNGDPVFAPGMKKLRNNTKSITFGLLYGMGPYSLSLNLKITLDEARKLVKKYFDTFPKIEILMDKLVKSLHQNRYATSPLDGRKLFFYDADWDDMGVVKELERKAMNFPFQGAGASTTKLSLVYINEQIKEKNFDAQILFAVHDEINLICSKDRSKEFAKMVNDQMIKAFNYYAPDIPMEIGLSIGSHWIH